MSALDYLLGRGLNEWTLLEYEVGYGEFHGRPAAFTFPIRDDAGALVTLKERFWPEPWFDLATGDEHKSHSLAGRGAQLYPASSLHGPGTLVICEGEITALVLNQHSIRAVTSTAGTSWKAEWTEHLRGQRVAVIYDVDAERITRQRVEQFRAAGIDAWPVLLSQAGFTGKTDPDEVIVRHGWPGERLRHFIERSRKVRRRERRSS